MKNKVKIIIAIIAIVMVVVVDIVIDLLLWVNALVDGKYCIEQSPDFVVDTYYLRISSLSAAMFVNLFLVIVLLFLLFIKRKR